MATLAIDEPVAWRWLPPDVLAWQRIMLPRYDIHLRSRALQRASEQQLFVLLCYNKQMNEYNFCHLAYLHLPDVP